MTEEIQKAIEILTGGGIVIFPTDTAFGIGCRIDDRQAVDRLFRIRERPCTQATPVLVSSKEEALKYWDNPSERAKQFMDTYWPGALTIIAPCKKNFIYSPIRGGGNTIGLRMPNHDGLLEVIRSVGVPILGPSANIHGKKTPYAESDLDSTLVTMVDFVLPGICLIGSASTVVDCSTDPYTIVREGAITL